MAVLFMILLFLTALFLILLILVQRGKGGGLAGALGGMGGQSAFGAKAGDTFTRVTIGVAAFWILLCIFSVRMLATGPSRLNVGQPVPQQSATESPADDSGTAPAPAPSDG